MLLRKVCCVTCEKAIAEDPRVASAHNVVVPSTGGKWHPALRNERASAWSVPCARSNRTPTIQFRGASMLQATCRGLQHADSVHLALVAKPRCCRRVSRDQASLELAPKRAVGSGETTESGVSRSASQECTLRASAAMAPWGFGARCR